MEKILSAEDIVKQLSDWSNKYPRGKIYSASNMNMDKELIQIEELAKQYVLSERDKVTVDVEKTARDYATESVFETNGHLFSNNNDEAGNAVKVVGDAFKAGYSLKSSEATDKVSRVEVICIGKGREYVNMNTGKVTLDFQDNGQTLKVFIEKLRN